MMGTGQRFRFNVISAIPNRGRLAFMVFRQRFTARVFLNFLGRLLRLTRKSRRKVFLILDSHPVHKAHSVSRWLAEHAAQIQVFSLPPYSPELNPDELLNQDVKTNALGRVRQLNLSEMMGSVRSYLCITQRRPRAVQNYSEAGWLDLEAVTSRPFLVSAAARLQPASRAPERLMQEPRRGLPLRDPLVSFLSKARL
jgi:DDE superfamily endonuclease